MHPVLGFRRVLPALLALSFLVLALPLAAFEGVVRRPDGSPAAGYQVSVVGRSATTVTDTQGRFRIDPTPQPPFELIVVGIEGYVSAPLTVSEIPAGVLEVPLPATYEDSITVSSGVAPNLDAPPAAATVIVDRENLEQRKPERLADVLENVAGANRSEEGSSGVPSLRGLARGRTAVLLDGTRVTAERRAGASATYLDPFTLGSVEIARGAGSVAYGSDAFGGVIDARPRYPEPGPLSARFDVAQNFGAGDDTSGGLEVSSGLGDGAILATIHARTAGDSEDGEGEDIFNSSYRDRGAAIRWAAPTPWGSLRLGYAYDRAYDLGKPAQDSRVTRAYYPDEESDRFNLGLNTGTRGSWENLELSLFAGTYRLVLDRDRFATAAAPRAIERSDVDSTDAVVRAVGNRSLAGGRLQLGLDVTSRFGLEALVDNISFDAAGNRTRVVRSHAIEDGERTDYGLFATWDRAVATKALVSLGARGDRVESKTGGGFFGSQSVSDGTFSGQAALTMGPFADTTVTLQVARGFRVPTLSDRFFRGPSGRGIVNGNPDLEPETSLQYDAAVRWSRSGKSLSFYAYRYDIDNLIERFRQGADFFFRNRGEARIQGAELEAQLPLAHSLGLEIGFAYGKGETPADGKPVNDISPTNGFVSLRWTGARGYAFLRGAAFASDDRPGPTEVKLPSYQTLDLGAGWQVFHEIELRLIGRNLTNEIFRDSADSVSANGRGRTLSLGLVGKI